MDYIISASTDIGIKKDTNQDCLSVKLINSPVGKIVFAVICDGMGGLQKGEVASAAVVKAFDLWINKNLLPLLKSGFSDEKLREEWSNIVRKQNNKILSYGRNLGINLGTTIAAALFVGSSYWIMNIGDSRVYEIADGIKQLTHDHTVVAREVEMGILKPEEALTDPRRNVLLQCIGASDDIEPEFYSGEIKRNSVYFLCSDGFIHEISDSEICEAFCPSEMTDKDILKKRTDYLIETDKQRMEKDNISVIVIKTN